jgi:hypothetical protein
MDPVRCSAPTGKRSPREPSSLSRSSHVIRSFRPRRGAVRPVAPPLCPRPCRRRRRCSPRPVAPLQLGRQGRRRPQCALGHRLRPDHRRDADELHRCHAPCDHGQRIDPSAPTALARGHHGQPAGPQCPAPRLDPWRAGVDPLARHPAAGRHGRRARAELQRHQPWRDLPVPLQRRAGRHLLVPQPFRLPGAGRSLRATGDRAAGTRALRL